MKINYKYISIYFIKDKICTNKSGFLYNLVIHSEVAAHILVIIIIITVIVLLVEFIEHVLKFLLLSFTDHPRLTSVNLLFK
jgi:hypothetical protein